MTLAGQAPAGQPTPGPWSVGDVSEYFLDADRMVYCDDALGSRIADCSNSGHGISVAQERANARLIASSPRLLQAAQDAYLQMLSVNDQWTRVTLSYQGALCQLRDSIAAATGRDPESVQDEYEARATGSQP